MELESTFGTRKPIIGMVHLPPLPGSPEASTGIGAVCDRAVADATALEAGGIDGLVIENFGDVPYYPESVPPHTVAAMTRAATEVRNATSVPIGVNVLRNDAEAALSIAAAVDAAFVRVNVHTGARVTDQGVLEGNAHGTLRLRDRLGADIGIFADIAVKHSTQLSAERSLSGAFSDAVERGLADAVIVSGPATGESVDVDSLAAALEARDEHGLDVPILVGSGVDAESVGSLLGRADGAIVGTALKRDGETRAPVSEKRVRELVGRGRDHSP
jgi:membrane complex biogenesis BtpA family protein